MAQVVIGNLWNDKDAELVLITTNSYVTKGGNLVMGRGAALELKNKYPWMATYFGNEIMKTCGNLGEYNLMLTLGRWQEFRIYGAFQVKYHFKDRANLELISRSVNKLNDYIEKSKIERVSMNYPGIGYGGRTEDEILPIIEKLSDKVKIYKIGNE